MKPQEGLQWIHDRLVNVHGEDYNVDYLQTLRETIEKVEELAVILEEISLGRGPFSMDPHEHASNVVDAMRTKAVEGMDLLGSGYYTFMVGEVKHTMRLRDVFDKGWSSLAYKLMEGDDE